MKSKFYTYTMRYGLYAGVAIALNFILSLSSVKFLNALSWAVWLITMLILYYSAVRYRKDECNNLMTYGNGFKFIFMTYLFGALVATAIRIIYLKWINPDVLTRIYEESMTTLEQLKLPNMNETRDIMNAILQPIKYAFIYLWVDMINAFFYGLIIALFTRKADNSNNVSTAGQNTDDII